MRRWLQVLAVGLVLGVTALVAAQPDDELPAVTARELKKMDWSQVVVLDARPTVMYEREHIAGARSLPTMLFHQRYEERAAAIPKSVLLVTYCGGPTCSKSTLLAQKLAERGHRVAVLKGGLVEWKAQGFSVEAGTSSQEAQAEGRSRRACVMYL